MVASRLSLLSGSFNNNLLFQIDGGVGNDGPGPETDCEHTAEGEVEKTESGTQAKVIADTSNDNRNDGAAHDSRAQNPRKRTVMLGNRSQRERNQNRPHDGSKETDSGKCIQSHRGRSKQRSAKAEQREGCKSDQYFAAIKNLEQPHADKAPGGQQSPKPGDRRGASGVRVVAVILRQKFRDPVCRSLLRANIGKHAEEKEPHNPFAEQFAVQLPRTRSFIFL